MQTKYDGGNGYKIFWFISKPFFLMFSVAYNNTHIINYTHSVKTPNTKKDLM